MWIQSCDTGGRDAATYGRQDARRYRSMIADASILLPAPAAGQPVFGLGEKQGECDGDEPAGEIICHPDSGLVLETPADGRKGGGVQEEKGK
jgi:hypothetical protein